ncbi:hypothetical protein RAO27_09445, partial [Lactiplantibacillus plantarum]
RLANTVSGYADKFVQKFGLNLQSTKKQRRIHQQLSTSLSAIRILSRLEDVPAIGRNACKLA